ncbi:Pimeloyl-ACP methyl ester carboxylesterase [Thermomonospora echinospora]|uniref:Pimeloyl-ACP methyl ester carboxylesterase n=1 Tax=Thermomonospora echinospora TaxID=1992 RepID=A0A1H5XRC4_9ACTN|nr:alpha/beta hydrolase [Thermomonospora echinospora]SEG14212.1 Pimeloyl-ACP methyl ester carboxylesterase [Thermomonospora echinospora]
MTEIAHRHIDVNGLSMHVAEAGSGPLVLLLHGFPECWYSWRRQLVALAEAGFHAVAPDQRGYARTGGPGRVEDYTILHLTGDVVALIAALGEEQAVVVGHDWGAPVAWHTAQFRPDLVRGVVGLSVHPRPRSSRPPVAQMREQFGDGFYMVAFQQPEVPEAVFERDLPDTFRRVLYAASGDAADLVPVVPDGGGLLDVYPAPGRLPGWLTEGDIATFAAEYASSGFTGPVNWYRNLDRNWELTAAWHRAPITPPALYIAGERDMVLAAPGVKERLPRLHDFVTDLRDIVLLPGCGHWTQQERPEEVNEALIGFLRTL